MALLFILIRQTFLSASLIFFDNWPCMFLKGSTAFHATILVIKDFSPSFRFRSTFFSLISIICCLIGEGRGRKLVAAIGWLHRKGIYSRKFSNLKKSTLFPIFVPLSCWNYHSSSTVKCYNSSMRGKGEAWQRSPTGLPKGTILHLHRIKRILDNLLDLSSAPARGEFHCANREKMLGLEESCYFHGHLCFPRHCLAWERCSGSLELVLWGEDGMWNAETLLLWQPIWLHLHRWGHLSSEVAMPSVFTKAALKNINTSHCNS